MSFPADVCAGRGRDTLFYKVFYYVCRVKGCLVGQDQRLNHVQRALLVLLEMFRGYMAFVGSLRGVCLQDCNPARVFFFGHGVHCQHPRLGAQGYFAHFGCELHVFVEVFGIYFYFRQSYYSVGLHLQFSACVGFLRVFGVRKA